MLDIPKCKSVQWKHPMPTQCRCPKCGFGGFPPIRPGVDRVSILFILFVRLWEAFRGKSESQFVSTFRIAEIFVWWPYHVSLLWKRWCEFDFFSSLFFDDTNRSNLGSIPWRWVLWSFSVSWMLLFLQPRGYLIGPKERRAKRNQFQAFFLALLRFKMCYFEHSIGEVSSDLLLGDPIGLDFWVQIPGPNSSFLGHPTHRSPPPPAKTPSRNFWGYLHRNWCDLCYSRSDQDRNRWCHGVLQKPSLGWWTFWLVILLLRMYTNWISWRKNQYLQIYSNIHTHTHQNFHKYYKHLAYLGFICFIWFSVYYGGLGGFFLARNIIFPNRPTEVKNTSVELVFLPPIRMKIT